jgi:hypothetical protein
MMAVILETCWGGVDETTAAVVVVVVDVEDGPAPSRRPASSYDAAPSLPGRGGETVRGATSPDDGVPTF